MSIRLSGWQRLGIVASVLWILGADLALRNYVGEETWEQVGETMVNCIQHRHDFEVCSKQADQVHDRMWRDFWKLEIVVVLVPLPLAWLLVYMFRGLWRWVRRGFVKEPEKIET